MKIGVFTVPFHDMSLEATLDYLVGKGIAAVELSTSLGLGNGHCNTAALLKDEGALVRLKEAVVSRGMFISALSCYGNILDPRDSIREQCRTTQRHTILLAEKLGVARINNFSGTPGPAPDVRYPVWLTRGKEWQWQWEEQIIPFWEEEVRFAAAHGVDKICLELHAGASVYSPRLLLYLRERVGETIGVNLDPSHFFWQGIDPLEAVRVLGKAIYHVHIKDTQIFPRNVALNGLLDRSSQDMAEQPWLFRTIGYGHGHSFWKAFVTALRLVGYDYVLSIEHEDPLMSREEAIGKSVSFLQEVLY